MKDSLYALKLTLIICVFYGLVLGFMLMVHNVWNMISNKNVQNTIAIILAFVIVGYDIYTKRHTR